MSRQKKKDHIIKAWGGFTEGKLYSEYGQMYDERRWAVFKTRKEARAAFCDVRAVKIVVETS